MKVTRMFHSSYEAGWFTAKKSLLLKIRAKNACNINTNKLQLCNETRHTRGNTGLVIANISFGQPEFREYYIRISM